MRPDHPLREELAAFLVEQLEVGDASRVDHTVQVTSFGGAGTTALCDHLTALDVDLQRGPAHWPFKHRRQPPAPDEVPDGFRVVYLVGDPRNAIVSLFRRGYQHGHFEAMRGRPPDAEESARLRSLEGFLAAGHDDYLLEDHLQRWLDHPPGYPVLVVRHERLDEAWDELSRYVGLSADAARLPVRRRSSDWRSLPEPQRHQIDEMYGDLAAIIGAMPATQVI